MLKVDLNGTWHLRHCHPGQGEALDWPSAGVAGADALAARVPGDVHLDLKEAGVIDEPLFGLNAEECRWMEEMDWWYSREFDMPAQAIGDRVELHFAGLDTTADIWLNGQHVGRANNMFVPHVVDITGAVRSGRNLLVVRLDFGLRAVADKDVAKYAAMSNSFPVTPRMWMRKAQFSFRWDHAPRLLTCGIWRPVELRSYTGAALRDVCLRTHLLPDGGARLEALLEVESFADGERPVTALLTLSGHGSPRTIAVQAAIGPGLHTLRAELDVPDAALWWPHSLGRPDLYDVEVELTRAGGVQDRTSFRYGLREVRLRREPLAGDEGESFIIEVNGTPVFCKGADWVPADCIMARVTRAKYRELVRLAAEANFNMLRIWGGGIYEDPCFYELCDEHGILVWQDFLFACTYCPDDDPDFVNEARREAELALRQLRNHPCIALWCGNNENQWLHRVAVARGGGANRCYGEWIYEMVLPEACARLDPTRPYWPSSPWGGDDPNSQFAGDSHAWYVNIGNPDHAQRAQYHRWGQDRSKFVTEFGVLSCPPLESLREFLPPGEIDRQSPSWMFHENLFDAGNTRLVLRTYWRPAEELSLAQYVTMSQVIQGEALKFALEGFRRRKFRTAGALFWDYSDSWGGVGWSIVDYYLRRKSTYFVVRRAFAPVLASIQQDGDSVSIWVVNDNRGPISGRLEYGLVDLRSGERRSQQQDLIAAANSAAEVARMELLTLDPGQNAHWAAYTRLWVNGRLASANRQFLAGFYLNKLELSPARLAHRLDGDALTISAEGYAWQVEVKAPRPVVPEDNYFDLLPGEERTVHLSGPAELAALATVSALNI